jgi:hypothetical protein
MGKMLGHCSMVNGHFSSMDASQLFLDKKCCEATSNEK